MEKKPMTQFKTEGEKAFPVENKENDTASDSSPENNEADQTPSSEGESSSDVNKDGGLPKDRGFADDPRWKERETDWTKRFNEQEARHISEISKLREDFAPKPQQQVEVPEWFGGDETAWNKYGTHTQQLIDRAVEKALGTISQKTADEQKAVDDASKYFQDEVAAIEADKTLNPQGQSIDRNKILKFVLDNELVDTKGRWNYKAAFKMMSPKDVFQAKLAFTQRKELANATITDNQKPEPKPSTVTTSADFSKPGARPW